MTCGINHHLACECREARVSQLSNAVRDLLEDNGCLECATYAGCYDKPIGQCGYVKIIKAALAALDKEKSRKQSRNR